MRYRRPHTLGITAVVWFQASVGASAHGGVEESAALLVSDILAHQWYPEILLQIGGALIAYLVVIGPIRRHFGYEKVDRKTVLWFLFSLFVFWLAEGTPLHTLSEDYLFSLHMVQHVLLTLIMPVGLILGTPIWVYRALLRVGSLGAAMRFLTQPLVAFLMFNAVYTLWHVPGLYQSALFQHDVHILEHALFIGTSILMWWPLLSRVPELPRLSEPGQIIYVFFLTVGQLAVFGPVTFANRVVYPFYADATRLWGITPQLDQQLAGIVMKVPAIAIFVGILGKAFFRWAAQEDSRYVDRRGPHEPSAAK